MTDIVNIGFAVDTRDIDKGVKRMDRLQNASEKAEGGVSRLAKGAKAAGANIAMVGTVATATIAAVSAFVYQLGRTNRELQTSARIAGMSVKQFQASAFVFKQYGLTIEQVNDIYKDSIERVGEWRSAQTGALQDFGDVMGWSKDRITEFANEVDGLTGQQLLQRMVSEMDSAGASASEMSFALEGMASEATRMIPALENNGEAISKLTREYAGFNAAFALDKEEVQNYADLTKNFDLFLETAQNGITKTLSPLAEVMGLLALEATEFLAALQSGSLASAQKEYNEALAEQLKAREMLGKALSTPDAFGADVVEQEIRIAKERLKAADDAVGAANKQLEAAKKTVEANLEVNRSSSRSVSVNVSVDATGAGTQSYIDEQSAALDRQAMAYDRWLTSVQNAVDPIGVLNEEITELWMAMLNGDLSTEVATARIEQLRTEIDEMSNIGDEIQKLDVNPFQSMTDGAQDALRAMNGMFESGSKDAKKLAVAMQALNLVQAVGAVLNQGKGDPYTAFGRMASMAAMVASLGMSIGGLSGGLSDASAERQESQGMNQWGEKAESITDATEMTANATSKLVGINTDMLKALQNLSASVFAAAGIAAKNIQTPQANVKVYDNVFEGFQNLFSGDILDLTTKVFGDFLGGLMNAPLNFIGKWLGGSSKVRDEGIQIMGGAITDLVDDVLIMSFQEVEYKKWRFGKKKKKTATAQVGDEVSDQFSLVFGSLIESVAVGAEALGLSQKEIEDAINGFNVATQKLSLKGMSVDQQADAINNYFSNVFNGLASEVVPFLDEFQIAGEELGQTLARLATQVSIAEYLTDNLGVSFGDKLADPRAYAEAADNLATLAGGVETLAEQTGAFTNAFATDAQKLSIYQEAMTNALSEVGLTLPPTAEGMYELMSSLDGTTEAGQEQIATLLGLTDTATAYFKLLDKTAGRYRDAAEAIYDVSFAVESVALDSALAAAKLGDFSLADQLDLGGLKPSKSDFGSLLEYNIARAETAAKLNELADLQSGSVSVDEKQLSVLQQIRDSIQSTGSNTEKSQSSLMENMRVQMAELKQEMQDVSEQLKYGTLTVVQES